MKTCYAAVALALVAATCASAADINVVGANPMMRSGDDPVAVATVVGASDMDARRAAIDVKLATKDLLNKSTGLVNKNTLAMDNNVAITRSNLVFSQNDRVGMMKKIEAMVMSADAKDMSAATLSKNILKVVSDKDTDTAVMSKASAVVAAKDKPTTRGQRIADLVNAVFNDRMTPTMDNKVEQAIQSQAPNGITILVGTKDILSQPTGVVNKNKVFSDNQVTISRSNLKPSQNDVVTLAGGAKVADYVAPASAISVDDATKGMAKTEMTLATDAMDSDMSKYRVAFTYNKGAMVATTGDATVMKKKNEQFGLWGGGLGFGWGYPLGYWNLYGAGLYGGGCGLGLGFGGMFYC